jgi:DNA-binding beta-propeller fold protein YncE
MYISNGNFNTLFDGGTVVALDLAAVEADGLACRAAQDSGAAAPPGCELRPLSPPTLRDTADLANRALPYIDAAATVEIASFPGDFVISPDGRRLFLPVRGDQSVTILDIDPAATGAAAISCEEEGAGRRCSGGHVLLSDRESAVPEFGTTVPGFSTGLFAMVLDFGREVVGAGAVNLAYVSHLDTGELSLFRLTPEGVPLFQETRPVATGVNQLAVHPQTGLLYVARRNVGPAQAQIIGASIPLIEPHLSALDTSKLDTLIVGDLPISTFDSGGADVRSLEFGSGGDRLYAGTRLPSAVVIFDTSLNEFGEPKNALVSRVQVGTTPEELTVVPRPGGGELVYVADFIGGRVHVVDPDLADGVAPADVIEVGRGPFGMTFAEFDGKRRLFVVNFDEDTVSAIDADEASATFNEVLYRIGAPRLEEEE